MRQSTVRLTMALIALFTALIFGSSAHGALYNVDISPPGFDHAIGLSALNAEGQPASSATGNVIGAGISYDDATNLLSFSFGYGQDFGFNDLQGDFTVAHLHGPVAVQFPAENTGALVLVGLDAFHTAGSSARTGSFSGSVTLTDANETHLLSNLIYINIHSGFAGGGEIRGQLVPSVVPLPAAAWLLLAPLAGIASLRRKTAA